MANPEEKKSSLRDLGDKEFFVSNGDEKVGFRIWIDSFDEETANRPKVSIHIEPLGSAHEMWSLRIDQCGLSKLHMAPDGATFITHPGGLEINAETKGTASALMQALKYAVEMVENGIHLDRIEQAEPPKKGTKREKLSCAANNEVYNDGFETILDSTYADADDEGEHGHRLKVKVKEGKIASRRNRKMMISLEALGDVYQEMDWFFNFEPLTFLDIANSQGKVNNPGELSVKFDSRRAGLTFAQALRKAAESIESNFQ